MSSRTTTVRPPATRPTDPTPRPGRHYDTDLGPVTIRRLRWPWDLRDDAAGSSSQRPSGRHHEAGVIEEAEGDVAHTRGRRETSSTMRAALESRVTELVQPVRHADGIQVVVEPLVDPTTHPRPPRRCGPGASRLRRRVSSMRKNPASRSPQSPCRPAPRRYNRQLPHPGLARTRGRVGHGELRPMVEDVVPCQVGEREPTVPTTHRRTVMVTLCAVALLAVSGCGGDATTSTPTKTSTTPASPAASQTYSSKALVVPLTVTVDATLKSPPNPDSRNLLSWDAAASENHKVRFLVPVKLYRPGSSTPEAPPKNYLKYLQGQTKDNVEFSKMTKITVDGHRAPLMTATSTIDERHPQGFLDGSLGCPERDADHSEGCAGIQPDFLLRLAVIDVGGTTLLAWARTTKDNPDEAFFAMFERMLKSVQFR
jgi:hypothetical protein